MPKISLHIDFDVTKFGTLCKGDNSENETLKPFTIKMSGDTTIGFVRASSFESLQKSHSKLFSECRGIDVYFKGNKLEEDDRTLIDIVGFWNGSTLTLSPSESVLDFVTAFLHHSDLYDKKEFIHLMLWNALHESVQIKEMSIWRNFVAQIFEFWVWNKDIFVTGSEVLLDHLFRFDSDPLRDYEGYRLLNVVMGTHQSVPVLRRVMIDDSILWITDHQGVDALVSCVLENDLDAFEYLMEFGVPLNAEIDINTGSFADLVRDFGSKEMIGFMDRYPQSAQQKREVIRNHDTILREGIPVALTEEITSFLLGPDPFLPLQDIEEEGDDSDEMEEDTYLALSTIRDIQMCRGARLSLEDLLDVANSESGSMIWIRDGPLSAHSSFNDPYEAPRGSLSSTSSQ